MACKLGKLLGDTSKPRRDRELLRQWLDTGRDDRGRPVSAAVMSRALTAEGHSIGSTTIKDHRGRRCVCWHDRS